MPRGVSASGFDPLGLLYILVVLAVIFAPVLFARRASPPAEEGGSEDPGGRGPRRPSSPPKPPIGGLPLPDADQSRTRLRDYRRLADHASRFRRRTVHRPGRRSPTRVG